MGDSGPMAGGVAAEAGVSGAQVEAETVVVSEHFDLTREVGDAKARLHRSIGQRARWARADFLREIGRLREQTEFLYPVVTQDVVVEWSKVREKPGSDGVRHKM